MNRFFAVAVLSLLGLCTLAEVQPASAQVTASIGGFFKKLFKPKVQDPPGQISFACLSDFVPGTAFGSGGQVPSLAPGYYLMTATQSGDFTLDSLNVGWNGLSIGIYQFIAGPSDVSCSGIIPSGATPGQRNKVLLKAYNIAGSLVAQGTHVTQVKGDSGGWDLRWSRSQQSDPLGDPIQYAGDFDGDGAEEILSVSGSSGPSDTMTMYHFDDGSSTWLPGWTNSTSSPGVGNPAIGDGIYPYRGRLIVGDFDGDGKDEVLGAPIPGWMTMFEFENGDWHWGWSSGGSAFAGDELESYKKNLIVGNFDGLPGDEILGAPKPGLFGGPTPGVNPHGGWKTLFKYMNSDWHAVWSTGGDPNHGLTPYTRFEAVDLNGNGKDELLGLDSWATTFEFSNNDFHWMWSTGGGTTLAGWSYPLASGDRVLVGQLDADSRDDVLLLQSVFNSCCTQSIDFENGIPNWRWSNFGMGYIGNWPLASKSGDGTGYLLVRAVAGQPEFLMTRRKCIDFWKVSMFQPDPLQNF